MMASPVRDADGVIEHSDEGASTPASLRVNAARNWAWCPRPAPQDAYDNAMAESFFASLQCELLNRRSFKSKAEARAALFTYIEGWYHPRRRHGSIGYLSPNEFERRQQQITQDRKLAQTERLTDPAGA